MTRSTLIHTLGGLLTTAAATYVSKHPEYAIVGVIWTCVSSHKYAALQVLLKQVAAAALAGAEGALKDTPA